MRLAKFLSDGKTISGFLDGNFLFNSKGTKYDPAKVLWLPPVSPTKIVGLVLNYADHANELGLAASSEPVIFLKPPNTLVGHLGDIVYPKEATYMHYEAELAVVIDKRARRIKAERANESIRGYTIANDVTVRDFITNTFRPPVRAKGFDTFCPLGPYLVTRDDLPRVDDLEIKTIVDGETRQKGSTRNFMHSIPKIIEFITSFMTLEPEDIILTGTPKGISPIVPGNKVDITIDNLGTLTNQVVAEQIF